MISATTNSYLVVVEQQAAEEGVGIAEGGLHLLAAAGNVPVAEHLYGHALVLPGDGLRSLRTVIEPAENSAVESLGREGTA